MTRRGLFAPLIGAFAAACSPLAALNTLGPRDRGAGRMAKGVPYGDDPRQTMDVYAPAGAASLPVLVFFYGGGWDSGSKDVYGWAAQALAAGIDLGYEGEEHLNVLGHPLLLREALNNLIDNALHYAGHGATVTVRVYITAPGMAALVVEDDGPGVPAAHLGDLFARFWRGSDKPGGCGLGLSIVEEIALRHGGETVAETAGPHGLRVGLRLPLA